MATSGNPEFRVVDACSSETCINPNTQKMFQQNDKCDPSKFAECSGCPRAQCVYFKFKSSDIGVSLQVLSFCGTVWLLTFVQSMANKLITNIITEWVQSFDAISNTRKMSTMDVQKGVRKTFKYQHGLMGCVSLFDNCDSHKVPICDVIAIIKSVWKVSTHIS